MTGEIRVERKLPPCKIYKGDIERIIEDIENKFVPEGKPKDNNERKSGEFIRKIFEVNSKV